MDEQPLVLPDALVLGDRTVDLARREVRSDSGIEVLTPLETNLLAYLAQRPDEVVTKRELLVKVWGYHANTRTRAPSLLVSRLRRKLGDDLENPRFLRTVRGTGYQLCGVDRPSAEPVSTRVESIAAAPQPKLDIPDPSFVITAAEARRLRRQRAALEEHSSEDHSVHAVRARLMVAWCALLSGEKPALEVLWRDAEQTEHRALGRLCALLALRVVENFGTQQAVLQATRRVRDALGGDVDDDIARCMVALAECTALGRLGELDAARARVDEASALAEQHGRPKLQALVSDRMAFLDRRAHRLRRAAQHSRDARACLSDCACIETHIEVLHNTATLHYGSGALEEAREHYEAARALADKMDAPHKLVIIHASLVSVCLNLAAVDGAVHHLDVLRTMRSPGDARRLELFDSYHSGRVLIEQGNLAEAVTALERAVHIGARTGEQRLGGYALLLLAWVALFNGETDEAEAALDDLVDILDSIADAELTGACALFSMWQAHLDGRTAAAEVHVQTARQRLRTARSPLGVFVGGSPRSGQEWLIRKCHLLLERHPSLRDIGSLDG